MIEKGELSNSEKAKKIQENKELKEKNKSDKKADKAIDKMNTKKIFCVKKDLYEMFIYWPQNGSEDRFLNRHNNIDGFCC